MMMGTEAPGLEMLPFIVVNGNVYIKAIIWQG